MRHCTFCQFRHRIKLQPETFLLCGSETAVFIQHPCPDERGQIGAFDIHDLRAQALQCYVLIEDRTCMQSSNSNLPSLTLSQSIRTPVIVMQLMQCSVSTIDMSAHGDRGSSSGIKQHLQLYASSLLLRKNPPRELLPARMKDPPCPKGDNLYVRSEWCRAEREDAAESPVSPAAAEERRDALQSGAVLCCCGTVCMQLLMGPAVRKAERLKRVR